MKLMAELRAKAKKTLPLHEARLMTQELHEYLTKPKADQKELPKESLSQKPD
jgi:hypothetical protein